MEMNIVIVEIMALPNMRSLCAKYGRKLQTGGHRVVGRVNDHAFFDVSSTNLTEGRILRFPPATSADPQKLLMGYAIDAFLAPLRYEIQSWRHLLPVRDVSKRTIQAASPPSDDVGQTGTHALPHLQKILEEDGERAEFVREHIKSIVDIDEMAFKSAMEGYISHATVRNLRTGGRAFLSEFGFGASQCIPVVVQGALMHPEHLLMVEQPEAQLHPSAQLEMGSFFADLWTQRKVYSIIETHSGNILLRLRRLIADPKHPLKSTDVSVAYVHNNTSRAPAIANLDIFEDGRLQEGLPMEFFGQDVIEGMKLRAKK